MKIKFTFKRDQYRKNRGDYSCFLNIFCDSCESHLALYQKDGAGELKRMYVDRIMAPKVLSSSNKECVCTSCKKVIGLFYNYKKENRQAIRLYQGSIYKKIGNGVYSS